TWYWGALVLLATFAAVFAGVLRGHLTLSRPSAIAIGLFAGYVAWSYLSMLWAQYPGIALDGSNRALLYLLIFTLLTALPWTKETVVGALLLFAGGVGIVGFVLMVRLASGSNVTDLFFGGRLVAPTGYINSTAALFTMNTLACIVLATRRRLAGPVRGLLIAFAAVSLQLATIVQSRGWLFTLPLIALAAIVIVPDRLRVAAAAVIPVVATLIPVRRLLHVYQSGPSDPLRALAIHAARPALAMCVGAFVVGTLLAWADTLYRGRGLGRTQRRVLASALALIGVAGVLAGGLVVSKGHPFQFISRQWHGFAHAEAVYGSSHFTDVGSGRYDYWRVALHAFEHHPIGGLGQDNFGDYYLTMRKTGEEPSWTHSLELRLLAHTGIVGFLLFGGFLVAAAMAAARTRRRGDPDARLLAAALLMPLVVWLIHGSLDWFWEVPALSGPALGFLGAAGGLGTALGVSRAAAPTGVPETSAEAPTASEGAEALTGRRSRRLPAPIGFAAGLVVLTCLTVVLAFPYLSAHEVQVASRASATSSSAALDDLRLAAKLNPLSSDPGRLAGAIALRNSRWTLALRQFRKSLSAEPGGWFSWLGAGLAESALGEPEQAHRYFAEAKRINARQPAVQDALQRVYSKNPLSSDEAFKLLVLLQ
ncbi:MAG TPA: O-antigen ligase family protein, partial [Polyangia bacterium]|nr:O-antigen ligase family protein [Polyangia bacterium]